MKKGILTILITIIIFSCQQDEQEITGSVFGVISSKGITVDGASIILDSTDQTTSDYKGRYSFENVIAKSYQIKISKGGYFPIKESLNIIGSENQIANFEIAKIRDPIIYTGGVSVLDQTTATANGFINFIEGDLETTEYGHCWSIVPDPTINDFKTELGVINSIGEYQSNISQLEAKTVYYIRSYISISNHVFYGNQVKFKTKPLPPKITDFNPKFGPVGTRVEIRGNNFTTTISENLVKFGAFTAEIESASENLLIVKVPYVDKNQKSNISVTIEDITDVSQDLFDIWFPWTKLGGQNSKTFHSASFVKDNFGYVIGSNSSVMLKYNAENDSWENNLSLPENSGGKPFSFVSGSKVFVLLNSSFWEYNSLTNSWTKRNNFPGTLQTDRRYNFNFSITDKLYIGNCYKTYDFWEYNTQEDSWKRKEDFIGNFDTSNPVWGNYTFSVDQKGFLGVSQTAFATNTLWEYNQSEDTWITKTPIPSNAYSLYASFVINNEAYVGLGRNFKWGDGYVSNKLWKYNPNNNTWIKLQNSPINMSVYASFGINNKGYILPIYTQFDKITNDVWEFNPSKN
ncbi:IPT/TIG domain-containing protein [Bacteroidota bacterium]